MGYKYHLISTVIYIWDGQFLRCWDMLIVMGTLSYSNQRVSDVRFRSWFHMLYPQTSEDICVESGYHQHSNNLCSMMPNDLGGLCYKIKITHELRNKKSGSKIHKFIFAHCLLCSNQLFDFFLLNKSNMVNNVLNLVSSWLCGLWSPHSSPYSLQPLLGQSYYFTSRGSIMKTHLLPLFQLQECQQCPSTSVAEYSIFYYY
jgi:hypothetical protein